MAALAEAEAETPLQPWLPSSWRVFTEEEVEVELFSWVGRALCEERREVERVLARRHEDVLVRLRRAPPAQAQVWISAGPPCIYEAREEWQALSRLAPAQAEVPWPVYTSERQGPTLTFKEEVEEEPLLPLPQPGLARVTAASAAPTTSVAFSSLQEGSQDGSSDGVAEKMRRAKTKEQLNILLGYGFETMETGSTSSFRRNGRCETGLANLLDVASGLAICLFIVMMAVWTEYRGFDLASALEHMEGFEGSVPSDQAWPHASSAFTAMEWAFGLFFSAELAIRIAFRIRLWTDKFWNALDLAIVAAFVLERIDSSLILEGPLGPTILRMARGFRLLRLLKLVRHVHSMDALHIIVGSLASSMSVLAWAFALLMLLMMFVGMVNANILADFIQDPVNDNEDRKEVFLKWGTFIRAYVSMFEITMDSGTTQCWLLMDRVSENWAFFFISWQCVVGFAVIEVITSVFIQHTFKVASNSEDFLIMEKQKASECYLKHLVKLFSKLDESGDGMICWEEFVAALEEPRVRNWFDALEVDVSDVPKLFMLLDDGSGQISMDEFIVGLKKLKGFAQSIDLVHVLKDCQRIRRALARLAGDAGMDQQHRGGCYLIEPTITTRSSEPSGSHAVKRSRFMPILSG